MRHVSRKSWFCLAAAAAFVLLSVPDVGAQEAEQTCFDWEPTIVGSEGDDVLTGTDGNDVIMALGGDDRVEALDGNDAVCGGPGDDYIDDGPGLDEVDGGEGMDACQPEDQNETFMNCERPLS
jgi:Ca2+-binding RTX toxin-like protein